MRRPGTRQGRGGTVPAKPHQIGLTPSKPRQSPGAMLLPDWAGAPPAGRACSRETLSDKTQSLSEPGRVVELADTRDLGSRGAIRAGSSPVAPTNPPGPGRGHRQPPGGTANHAKYAKRVFWVAAGSAGHEGTHASSGWAGAGVRPGRGEEKCLGYPFPQSKKIRFRVFRVVRGSLHPCAKAPSPVY